MKRLLKLLFHPLLLLALGLIAVSVLIWFGGPYLKFGSWPPLESALARIILISIIVGFFILRAIWRWLKSKWTNAKLLGALSGKSQAPEAPPSPGAQEVEELSGTFKQAIDLLRKDPRLTKVKRSWFGTFTSRLRGQYLHDLPWYMIIGRPASGKSTLLENSGLTFPLEKTLRGKRVRGEGGTRNCTWLFTDEAVLIDLAGRYTTHEADAQVDSEAWAGFLNLLKQYRTPRPINGLLLAVSVKDLERSEAERRDDADILGARLHEIHEALGIRFPIYIVVTQVDLLAGFTEFFGQLDDTARQSVWGVSFPNEDRPSDAWLSVLPSELKLLEQRIYNLLPERMQQERNPNKRALMYAFPQEFAWSAHKLRRFLDEVFSAERHAHAPLVRGVYYTSGTQVGNPIDRVLGTLSRTLGLSSGVVATPVPSGRSFFIKQLLREVIFTERDLAGTNLKAERRRGLLQIAGYVGIAIASLLLLGAWTTSYFHNKRYIDSVSSQVDELKQRLPQHLGTVKSDVNAVVPMLDSVLNVANTAAGSVDNPPLLSRMGLFQGGKLADGATSVYQDLLRNVLLPRVSARLEEHLREGNDDFGLLYDRLKTYLMLHQPKHYHAENLKVLLAADLTGPGNPDIGQDEHRQLLAHIDALIENRYVQPEGELNEAVIAEARAKLRSLTLPDRIYQRLKGELLANELCSNNAGFRVSDVVGPVAATIFTSSTNKSRASEMPAFFTKQCYRDVFLNELSKATENAGEEELWVMGVSERQDAKLSSSQALQEAIRRLYLTDYAVRWSKLVTEIRLVETMDMQRVMHMVSILAEQGQNSPLPKLVRALGDQTRLHEPGVTKKVEDLFSKFTTKATKLIGIPPKASSARRPTSALSIEYEVVDSQFLNIHRQAFPASEKEAAPIDAFPALMTDVHNLLIAAKAAKEAGQPSSPKDIQTKLATASANQTAPVKKILENVGNSCSAAIEKSDMAVINDALSKITEQCKRGIANRYPFVHNKELKVTRSDFEEMFRADGLMDAFFKKHLESKVDTSSRPWRIRSGNESAVTQYSSALVQFQRAATIREAFFMGNNPKMEISLQLKLIDSDPSISEVIWNIDGDQLRFRHGYSLPPLKWPGKMDGTRAAIQFLPFGSEQSAIVREGPWALQELIEEAKVERTNAREKLLVTFTMGGRSATFEATSGSALNPFQLRELLEFKCPRDL